jgi:hypothetical protein
MTTIVFVHLNGQIPRYLRLNIQSLLNKFPERKIVLIHNQAILNWAPKRLWQHRYLGSREISKIENLLGHPRNFRKNFWFTSIARFDAIRDYIQITDESVIHIESDVIISTDFPFERFESLKEPISYPIVASNRGVASTLFIRDLVSANLLISSALQCVQVDGSTSDMEILSFHEKSFSRQVSRLAFAPPAQSSFHDSNPCPNLDQLRQSIEHFEGIFDGNDVGVFLFGTDPRNHRGLSLLRSEISNNYASPKNWVFIFDRNRKFVSIRTEEGILPIYSIHATCKQLFLFWEFSRIQIIKKRVRDQLKPPKNIFFPSIFSAMAIARLFQKK